MRALYPALFTAVSLFTLPTFADAGPPAGPTCSADGLSTIGADGRVNNCVPYRCDTATGACRLICSTTVDCSAGTVCREGLCTRISVCTADGEGVVTPDGAVTQCAPFRCDPLSGACKSACRTNDDCARGGVCDSKRNLCVGADDAGAIGAGPESDETIKSGCACDVGGRSTSTLGVALGALALCALGRRRRSSR